MGLVKWVALLTCGHIVGGTTVDVPYNGMPYWCSRGDDCHSTTVVDTVTDLAERDTQGKL